MPVSHTSVKQTRRERGKLAQREYRKRHASTFQALKEENQSLKDSIRHLTAVAATIHPRQLNPDLGVAIDRLREIAGLADQYGPVAPAAAAAAVSAATSTDTSNLDMLFPVSDSSGGMVSPTSSGPAMLPTSVAMSSDPLGAMTGATMHDPSLGFSLSLDHQPHHPHHQPHHHAQQPHHHHSQHHQQQTLPPLPPPQQQTAYGAPPYEPMYFGPDMFSFAGRLFWDCVTYNVIRTQRLQRGTATRTEQVPGADAYTMPEEDQEMLAAMARTRLQYREPMPDYITPPPPTSAAYTPAGTPHQHHHQTPQNPYSQHLVAQQAQQTQQRGATAYPVHVETPENYYLGRCAKLSGPGQVASDLAELGTWWRTPAGVEAFVRERLTYEEFRGLEDALNGRDVGDEGESRIRIAVQALVPNAIYFPDGPRWNVMYLAMVFGSWVREIKARTMSLTG